MKEQLTKIAAWFSQGFNVIFLNGHQNQTFSARCYINRNQPVWEYFYFYINHLFFWQSKDHCYQSYLRDIEFAKDLIKEKGD